MTTFTAIGFSAFFGCIYVVILYAGAPRYILLLPSDHPTVIKYRVVVISIITLLIMLTCHALISFNFAQEFWNWDTLRLSWTYLGLDRFTFVPGAIGLVVLLYLGPLAVEILDFYENKGSYWRFDWRTFRNLLAGPVTEEIVFRAAVAIPLFLSKDYSFSFIVWVSPLFFGMAHLHHFYESYLSLSKFRPFSQAVSGAAKRTLFQFAYTYIFGIYASYMFLKTGCLYSVITTHIICNALGFPELDMNPNWRKSVKTVIRTLYISGPLFFVYGFIQYVVNADFGSVYLEVHSFILILCLNMNSSQLLVGGKHDKYFERHLRLLPHYYQAMDTNRLNLCYFAVSALQILPQPASPFFTEDEKSKFCDWLYSHHQLVSPEAHLCGFRGSTFSGPLDLPSLWHIPHVTMTYVTICLLLMLGDDLTRLKKVDIIRGLTPLQRSDGSIAPFWSSLEADLRFCFCACAVSYLCRDWSGLDQSLLTQFIKSCQSFDGGFGQGPGQESQGGSTFCAVACLSLMDKLDQIDRNSLVNWLVQRQQVGFQGRVGKPDDTCYAFWIGASLKMLGVERFVDKSKLYEFLSTTRSVNGGFGKTNESGPDLMHSQMACMCISLLGDAQDDLFVPLDLPLTAYKHWQNLQF